MGQAFLMGQSGGGGYTVNKVATGLRVNDGNTGTVALTVKNPELYVNVFPVNTFHQNSKGVSYSISNNALVIKMTPWTSGSYAVFDVYEIHT